MFEPIRDGLLEILTYTLPLGELHLQIFVIEEECRLTNTTFQLPVEPFDNGFGIVAAILLVVGTAVSVLRVQHHYGDVIGNTLIVFLCISVGDISRTADHIEHRGVEVLQALFRGTHHLHIADTRIQHHASLDARIVGHSQYLSTTA